LEQEWNSRKSAVNRGSEADRVYSLRSETTEQNCYGQGIHFDGAWAQKWAQFGKSADFWLLRSAVSY
jgi:hypothetical protein